MWGGFIVTSERPSPRIVLECVEKACNCGPRPSINGSASVREEVEKKFRTPEKDVRTGGN